MLLKQLTKITFTEMCVSGVFFLTTISVISKPKKKMHQSTK